MTVLVPASSPEADNEDLPAVVDTSVAAEPVVDANAASSSNADALDAKQPESLLDVVKAVVEPPKVPEASSAPEGDQIVVPENTEAKAAEAPAEDDANLPFHNHPRWKSVIAERDSLREPADRYQKITGFMETHGLVAEEVAEGFEIMALLKSNTPENLGKARDWFSTRLHDLDQALGNVLPADLQSKVDEGLLDDEAAQEVARSRASVALHETRVADQDKRANESREAVEARGRAEAMTAAVGQWETRIKASDPDYAKKAAMVETTCLAIIQRTGKPPANAEEATALADAAYAEVNSHFKGLLPKPKPITPSPHGSSAVAPAAPTTLREAVAAGLARSK